MVGAAGVLINFASLRPGRNRTRNEYGILRELREMLSVLFYHGVEIE